MKYTSIVVLVLGCLALVNGALPDYLKKEIQELQGAVGKIVDYVLEGAGKKEAYNRLFEFTDTYGARFTGTDALENSINGMKTRMENDNLNVTTEEVQNVQFWTRGEESARIILPRQQKMDIMGLGSSIGCNKTTFDVVVVDSVETLNAMDDNHINGKLVVFNQPFLNYTVSGKYRINGAVWASAKGAKAVLIRSVTDFSLYTPHTGQQVYNESVADPIPTACITVEDAELLQRYYDTGQPVQIELIMGAITGTPKTSYNLVAQINGSTHEDEAVIFGGHIDSWDVGQGVMDDGGGIIISWEALSIVNSLINTDDILPPKRTMRAVMWTAEEVGLTGSNQYYEAHVNDSVSLVMESDYGTFTPRGIGFTGGGPAREILEEVMSMLDAINATGVGQDGSAPDTGKWQTAGFPVANLDTKNENYFYYHHTHADTITMQDSHDLDLCAIVWTASAYVVASLDDMLPRGEDHNPPPTTPITDDSAMVMLSAVLAITAQLFYLMLVHG